MFLYYNVNNLTIKLPKSYNSLYQRIRIILILILL